MKVYLIGSLRNPEIPGVAKQLREAGFDTFDDWHSAGPDADDRWQEYEQHRGRSYEEALNGKHATNVYAFDVRNLRESDAVVLVGPAGKSAHLELGWALGKGKPGFILLPGDPDRFDIMYRFADAVLTDVPSLIECLDEVNR